MANNKFGANIVLEGEAEYRKALKNINSEQRELRSEMKLCSSTFDGQQNSIAALTKKGEILSRQYETQAKKVEIYSRAVEEAARNQEEAGNKVEGLKADLEAANRKMEEMSASTDTSNEALEEQQKIIEELKNKLALAEDGYSRAQTVTNNWQTSLNEAQAGLNDLSHEIQNNEQYLNEARNSMDGCADSIDEYGNEIEEAQEQTSTFADVLRAELVGDAIKKGIGMVVDGLKNITSTAISMGKSFESSMSNVAATMGITAEEIHSGSAAYETLEKAAKECGKSTKYSASEAADALNYLALAGYDAQKAAKTLPSVLDLAAAGDMELAAASDLVTDSMSALGMETDELGNYIDEMARAAQKSNTSVAQLGEATLVCAGTVSLTGQSLETMNAELGVLANNGIKSAEGGTHLRNILLSLSAPTDTAAGYIKELGLQIADSSGNMRDLNDIMVDLDAALTGMSSTEKTRYISRIFNKTDVAAVNALLKGTGLEFNNLKNELLNCDGAAKDMAETMGDNLEGKITILNSALEGLGITGYEKIEGVLKKSVEAATDSVGRLQDSMENGRLGDAMDEMAEALGEAAEKAIGFGEDALPVLIDGLTWIIENSDIIISGIAGITAANIAHGKVIPLISAVTKAWNDYKVANEGATVAQWALNAAKNAFSLAGLITAIAAVTAAIAAYVVVADSAYKDTKRFIDNANRSIDALNENAQARKDNIADNRAEAEVIKNLTAELEELNSQEELSAEQKTRLKMVVDQLNTVMPELNLTIDDQTGKLQQSNEEIEKYIKNLQRRQEQEAYEGRMQQIIDDQIEAQKLLNETTEKYNDFIADMGEPKPWWQQGNVQGLIADVADASQIGKLQEVMTESQQIVADLTVEYEHLSVEYEAFLKVENEVIDETEDLNHVMVEYKGTTYAVSSEVANNIAELDAAYSKAYEEAEKSLSGQIGLFEELEIKSDLTVEKMADNLQKQAEVMTAYTEDLQKAMELARDGVLDSGLLDAISEMGIDGAGYLHELVTAAEEDSEAFSDVMEAWGERVAAKETLTDAMADVKTGYSESLDKLVTTTGEKLDEVDDEFGRGVTDIADTALNGGRKIGRSLGEGIDAVFSPAMQKSIGKAASGVQSMLGAMRGTAKINSPSKETQYIGNMMGEGLVIGEVEALGEGRDRIKEAMYAVLRCGYENIIEPPYPVLTEPICEMTDAFTDQSSALADAGNAMLQYMVNGIELDGSVESTTERVEQLRETYEKAREEAEQSIDSQVKLFDKLEMKSDVTIKDMIESLRSQTAYFIEYGADLSKAVDLAQQGLLDKGLLGAIQELGLNGAGYLHELVAAAQSDMTSFNTVMSEWAQMSQTKENLTATMAGVEMLYGGRMDEVVAIQKYKGEEIEAQVKATTESVKNTVSDSSVDIVSKTSDGIDNATEVISKKSPEVENAVTDLCSVAVDGFEKSLDIDTQGRSKKFAAIGYSIPQGIADGIYEGQDLVTNAVRDVIENAISTIGFEGLSGTIVRKINEELGGLID